MTDCILQKLDNGKWWCETCDKDRSRLLPVNARRNCIIRDRSKDSRKMPSLFSQASNLVKAMAEFILDECTTVTEGEYKARLETCLAPEDGNEHCANLVNEDRCGKATGCGCYIAVKAKGRVWDCPRGKWPKQQ